MFNPLEGLNIRYMMSAILLELGTKLNKQQQHTARIPHRCTGSAYCSVKVDSYTALFRYSTVFQKTSRFKCLFSQVPSSNRMRICAHTRQQVLFYLYLFRDVKFVLYKLKIKQLWLGLLCIHYRLCILWWWTKLHSV